MGFESFPSVSRPEPSSKKVDSHEQDLKPQVLEKWQKMVAAIVAGAALAGAYKGLEASHTAKESEQQKIEYLEKNVLDLGELAKNFESGLQVKSESGKYILHIAQVHGNTRTLGTENELERDYIAQEQKKIGKLIEHLKDRYGIEVYFNEGDVARDAHEFSRPADANVLVTPDQITKGGKLLIDAYHKNKGNVSSTDVEHRMWKYRTLLSMENIERFYFQHPNQPEGSGIAASARAIVDELKKDATLESEAMWNLGSARWLAEQGKITLLPAETVTGNEDPENPILDKEEKWRAKVDTREDVAIGMSLHHVVQTNEKFVPIIYGQGHDFSDNVHTYNAAQTNPTYRMGLIRIALK